MTTRYEIGSANAVKVFYDDATVPSLLQPHFPSGEAWADAAEATAWAELYVASVTDEDAPYAPLARGEAGRAKPTAEQKTAIQAAQKAVKDAKTPEDHQAARQALKDLFESFN
jgi:hypothetical protein